MPILVSSVVLEFYKDNILVVLLLTAVSSAVIPAKSGITDI